MCSVVYSTIWLDLWVRESIVGAEGSPHIVDIMSADLARITIECDMI